MDMDGKTDFTREEGIAFARDAIANLTARRAAIAALPDEGFVVGWDYGLFWQDGCPTRFFGLESATILPTMQEAAARAVRTRNAGGSYAKPRAVSAMKALQRRKLTDAIEDYACALAALLAEQPANAG